MYCLFTQTLLEEYDLQVHQKDEEKAVQIITDLNKSSFLNIV